MRDLNHVRVVLARPSEPRNIGAACRAIKNFGITHLVVVGNADFDRDAARPLAIGAHDVLDSIRHEGSLRRAVADCSLVAGTTRRTGQKRKLVSLWPWELAVRIARLSASPGKSGDGSMSQDPFAAPQAAIVFGNETSGLSDEELQECQIAVNIPTSELAPSLNLSHAVEVICYELWSELSGRRTDSVQALFPSGTSAAGSPLEARTLATSAEVRGSVSSMVRSLNAMGFHTQDGPQGMHQFLQDVLGRAGLSQPELVRLEKLFVTLEGMGR